MMKNEVTSSRSRMKTAVTVCAVLLALLVIVLGVFALKQYTDGRLESSRATAFEREILSYFPSSNTVSKVGGQAWAVLRERNLLGFFVVLPWQEQGNTRDVTILLDENGKVTELRWPDEGDERKTELSETFLHRFVGQKSPFNVFWINASTATEKEFYNQMNESLGFAEDVQSLAAEHGWQIGGAVTTEKTDPADPATAPAVSDDPVITEPGGETSRKESDPVSSVSTHPVSTMPENKIVIQGTGTAYATETKAPVVEITTEPPVTDPPVTEPPISEPPITEPPISEPPVTEPPVTEPPISEPPVTEPPVTEPPISEPPVTEPPVTEPPISEPPISEPPVSEPPVTEPPVTEPPVSEPPISEPPVTEPSVTESAVTTEAS